MFMSDPISRKGFLRSAAVGAAAASGVASADYFPPTPVPEPNDNVVVKDNKVFVYPTDVEEANWANLDLAINYHDKDVYLMDRSKEGEKMNFKLPACQECDGYYGVGITRDVNIVGHGNPEGSNATIEGGFVAFFDEGHHNVSIQKTSFLNQDLASVYGYFNDFVFKENRVALDPIPLPEPKYGIFLEEISGSMKILKNDISNFAGIICKEADGGEISQNTLNTSFCGIYAKNIQNTEFKGNVIDSGWLAGIILDGGTNSNEVKSGKLSGQPFFGAIVLGQENAEGNSILTLDLNHLECVIAGIGINPEGTGSVTDTVVKGGPGSVSLDPIPLPDPKRIVLDKGTSSQIKNFQFVINEISPEQAEEFEEFQSLLGGFRYAVNFPFGGGGDQG